MYLVPGGEYLVLGGVPGPGGCTWSGGGEEGYLVLGGVPSRGGVPGPGGCTWSRGGVPGLGGCTWSRGVYLVWGGVPGQVLPPPVNRMTNRCKNITLAKTSFRLVIN